MNVPFSLPAPVPLSAPLSPYPLPVILVVGLQREEVIMRFILKLGSWQFLIIGFTAALVGGVLLPSSAIEHPIENAVSLCLLLTASLCLVLAAIGLIAKAIGPQSKTFKGSEKTS